VANPSPRRRPEWWLNRSWAFESSGGKILYFPHTWGRGYLVPTEAQRREIQHFLGLWRARLMTARRVARWVCLPSLVVAFTIFPAFSSIAWYIPQWQSVAASALAIGALCVILLLGAPFALAFLAETAKAELEKAHVRRSFGPWFIGSLRLVKSWRLWFGVACALIIVLQGVWMVWPTQQTVMLPASSDPRFVRVGLSEIAVGGLVASVLIWLIRLKRRE
jgi:hypothetical protein